MFSASGRTHSCSLLPPAGSSIQQPGAPIRGWKPSARLWGFMVIPETEQLSITQSLQKTLSASDTLSRTGPAMLSSHWACVSSFSGCQSEASETCTQYLSALNNFPDHTAFHLVRTGSTLWDYHEPLLYLNMRNLRLREEDEGLSKVTECAPAGSTTKM